MILKVFACVTHVPDILWGIVLSALNVQHTLYIMIMLIIKLVFFCKIPGVINYSPTPFEVIGVFLEDLLKKDEISNHVLPKRVKQDHKTLEVGGILHIAMEFTQSDIMKLLLTISKCLPENYDIFYCGPHTTTQDLNLFIDRCREFGCSSSSKWREFYFLEINKLLYEHQEVCSTDNFIGADIWSFIKNHANPLSPVAIIQYIIIIHYYFLLHQILMNLYLNIKHQTTLAVHFIETKPSLLRTVPGICLHEHKVGCIIIEVKFLTEVRNIKMIFDFYSKNYNLIHTD